MFVKPINTIETASKSSDLLSICVISATLYFAFLLACGLLSIHLQTNWATYAVLYAGLGLTSISLSKYFLSRAQLGLTYVARSAIANAIGLLFMTFIFILLQYIIPGIGQIMNAIILASVMTFFILGTLTPLLKPDNTDPS